jgi:branched-chain amino acid transport system substrate-binding protein
VRARPARRASLVLGVALAVTACSSSPSATSPSPTGSTSAGSTPAVSEASGASASSGPSGSGAAATAAGVVAGAVPTTRGLSEDAVFVGGLASLTDSARPALAGVDVGARARFARANAEGGVHGRRIELIEVIDDTGDPARAAAAARRLVETDGVLAVVPLVSSVLTPEVQAVLTDAGIPSFGWGPGFCDPIAFGITGCWPAAAELDGTGLGEALASPAFVAAVAATFPDGTSTVVVGDGGTAGRAAVDRVADLATAQGLRVVASDATFPPDAPVGDFDPWVDRILTADAGRPAELVIQVGRVVDILGLAYQLRVRGYTGAQASPRTYDPALVLSYPLRYRIDGMLVGTPFTPVETPDDPAIAQAGTDLRAAGIPGDMLGSPALLAGYWAADLFLQLLDAAGPDPTPAALVAAADGFTYDGGGVGPSTWPAAHAAPVACTHLMRVVGFTYDNGLPGGRFDIVTPRTCT